MIKIRKFKVDFNKERKIIDIKKGKIAQNLKILKKITFYVDKTKKR